MKQQVLETRIKSMDAANSFKCVARGGALFLTGTILATLLQFVSGIIVIRTVTSTEFGIFSLSYMLIYILVIVSSLGFDNGIPRLMAQRFTQGKKTIIGSITGTSLLISFSVSLVFALLLYFGANVIAQPFGKSGMQQVLKIFSLLLPPLTLINILNANFRGLKNTKAKVIFNDILLNLLRVALLLGVVLLGLGYKEILWVYIISAWIPLVCYLIHALRGIVKNFRPTFDLPIGRELISFSLPLLGIAMMANMIEWAGTLSLGYLRPSVDVALFNAPLRLVKLIPIPLSAMVFLYLPIATALTEREAFKDLQELYQSTTKWSFLITLPMILYFLFDAEFVTELFFGEEYINSANILRVLAIGFSFHTFLGPNGMTLISYGNSRPILTGTVISAISTLVLCLIFVPYFGALGAAVGTAIGRMSSNIYISFSLVKQCNIYPFGRNYIKPVSFAVTTSLILYTLLNMISFSNAWAKLILFVGIVISTILAPIITRSMSKADMELVEAVERRLWGKTYIANYIATFSGGIQS